jgi:prepilin-type N-terminal cleavage/methylation domain-containing protein
MTGNTNMHGRTAPLRFGPSLGRRGFTLIELLVVIAIIAVLISILMPVLASARNEGDKLKCLANLREISVATAMYMDSQEDQKLVPWYTSPYDPPYSSYPVRVLTPWVFGGFIAPDPEPGPMLDSSVYPAEIRLLNKFVDPTAQGRTQIDLYKCPGDRSFTTSIIGTPPTGDWEEARKSWQANGNSYTLNTRFMQGYAGGSGDFSFSDMAPFTDRIAKHLVGGKASEFIMWVEQGFYSATYRASRILPNGAGPQRLGWHRKFSKWTLGFADGHAVHTYYDTRLKHGAAGTIWQPGF